MIDLRIYNVLKSKNSICKLTTAKDETIIRCPFCGDSISNPHDAHLYISNTPPFKFFCQKCNVAGIVNRKFLNNFSIYDSNIIDFIDTNYINYKKNLNKKYGSSVLNFRNNKNIIYKLDGYTDNDFKKLDYIENRLGITISESDLDKYKIVLNLKRFLELNDLYKYTNDKMEMIIKDITANATGFLSFDKNIIVNRYINNNKVRYNNFRIITENIEQSIKFFSISNNIDLKANVINVIITEGIFDIIGIYNHFYKGKINESNYLFLANNGKSYAFVFNALMKMGVLNANITIYSDKDVPINFFKKLYRNNIFLNLNGLTLYYNNINKDFGVTKDLIELSNPIIFNN